MGKRSRLIEDDDLDESSASSGEEELDILSDPDARAEAERHRDPYSRRRKRSKHALKEDALYGVFAQEQESDQRPRLARTTKLHKTPLFVRSEVPADNPVDIDELGQTVADDVQSAAAEDDDMDVSDSESEEEEVRAPRIRSASPEEAPRAGFGGPRVAGLGAQPGMGLGAAAGMGGKGGIGTASTSQPDSGASTPTAFGTSQRKQQSFLSASTAKPASPFQPIKLDHKEKQHFSKLQKEGGLGWKLLSKQGWSAGTGLGAEGRGIVAPIESQLRPRGMGIGHEGFKERTKQSIREAKRQGKEISDDEEEKAAKRAARARRGASPSERAEAWKQPKERKQKVEYKSYDEILAEHGGSQGLHGGLGQIVDLTGAELPSLASTLAISGQPVFDDSRLPELRHNLRLIRDTAKGELDALAREAKAGLEKRNWIGSERKKVETRTATEAGRIIRLKAILADIEELSLLQKAAKKAPGLPSHRLATFDGVINRLLDMTEYAEYDLDEAVVAAVAPTLKVAWLSWEPLEEPSALISELSKWRLAFRIDRKEANATDAVDVYGQQPASRRAKTEPERTMTPYEALIWNHWLPRVRSAINGTWSPSDPAPAVDFLQIWGPLLPRFVRENILDQLVLPKLSKAIGDWTPRRASVPLHNILFPWLPHLGERMDEVVDEAKRRLKGVVKAWRPNEGVPQHFARWQKLFAKSEWDTLLLQHVLPPLGAHLRNHLVINPRDQKMSVLEDVLDWKDILRPSMLSQLLEAEFVSKWLDALFTWLTANPNHEQISQWYEWWKQWLAENGVVDLPGIKTGLGKALNLMNSALSLGEDAPYLLERPDTRPSSAAVAQAVASQAAREQAAASLQAQQGPATSEMSFRELVEAICAENDLVFVPLGRAHAVTGLPLFRVSSVGRKVGVTVYLQDDVAWAQVAGEERFEPIGLEAMVERARK